MMVDIELVRSGAQLEEFIRFPFWLYRDDPNWVPPLLSEQRKRLSPAHNPFFEHADLALWLARRAGQVVGTVSAQVDHRHNQVHQERAGQFGFFETVNDYVVAECLLTTARTWLHQRDISVMRGPIDLNFLDGAGLLIAGDDQPPAIMLTHSPPYYAALCERFGLCKARDAYVYALDLTPFQRGQMNAATLPPAIQLALAVRRASRVTLRAGCARTIKRDLLAAKPVLDDAFARNWGWVPMTSGEYAQLTQTLQSVGDPTLVFFAEADGGMVGFAAVIPDYNQILKHLGGSLWPVGWLKAVWLKHRGTITRARFLVLGVLEQYRHQGIEAMLIARALAAVAQKGYRTIEFSYVWENNMRMNQLIQFWGKDMGVRLTRTYRVYEMAV